MTEVLKENHRLYLETIRPNPNNYRIHTEIQIKNIQASLIRFGQGRSIVCQEQEDGTYMLVAGHGVFEAARRLNYRQLRADILPKSWSPTLVSGYLVSDNKLSEGGHDDQEKLLDLLREQASSGVDLASLGTSAEDMQRILEEMAFDDDTLEDSSTPRQPEEDDKGIEKEQPSRVYTPPVRYAPIEAMPTPQTVASTETGKGTVLARTEQHLGTTPEESLFRYNTTTIRQIVLIYSQEEYTRVMELLSRIREHHDLDTNTDAITHLLNRYAEEHDLEKIPMEQE